MINPDAVTKWRFATQVFTADNTADAGVTTLAVHGLEDGRLYIIIDEKRGGELTNTLAVMLTPIMAAALRTAICPDALYFDDDLAESYDPCDNCIDPDCANCRYGNENEGDDRYEDIVEDQARLDAALRRYGP